MSYKKILVVNLAGVGDMLLCQPALRALRAAYPASQIWLLTSAKVRELQPDFMFFDKWLTINIDYGRLIQQGQWLVLARLIWRLRREQFDLAINMRTLVSAASSRKIKWLFRAINATSTAGRNTNGWGAFFTLSIPETLQGEKYEREYDIELAELLGAVVNDRSIVMTLRPNHISRVQELLISEGLSPGDMLVGIHPGGMPSRRWPAERFSRLIDRLYETYHCRVILTGSAGEAGLCTRISGRAHTKVVSVAGKISLYELGALVRRCRLFVSNDTGPMHIAAVLQTPLVALFGPGDITRFDPRVIFPRAQVVYQRAPCAPCEKPSCPDGRCMAAISVEAVYERVRQVLTA